MKLPSRHVCKKIAAIAAAIFVLSLAIMLWRLFGMYGCTSLGKANNSCSGLEATHTITLIAGRVAAIAFVAMIISLVGAHFSKKSDN